MGCLIAVNTTLEVQSNICYQEQIVEFEPRKPLRQSVTVSVGGFIFKGAEATA